MAEESVNLEDWPLHAGSHGQRTKTAQWLLSGHNVIKLDVYHGEIDGIAGKETIRAFREGRRLLGFPNDYVVAEYGPVEQEYLLGKRKLPLAYRVRRAARLRSDADKNRKKRYYPLARKAQTIGVPGQGTHSWWVPPNNWQSDNAVDLGIPGGTPVLAYADGRIGSRIGPLQNGASRFHGQRLYLETADNQFYYAHLATIVVKAGQKVTAGQILGYSGVANGVWHLHWASKNGNPVTLLKGL